MIYTYVQTTRLEILKYNIVYDFFSHKILHDHEVKRIKIIRFENVYE